MFDLDAPNSIEVSNAIHQLLSGLNNRDTLDVTDIQQLKRDLSTLAQKARPGFTSHEQLTAENIIAYTFRPTVESCLEIWFGKSQQTDDEIWRRFGADVLQASQGHYDHWALSPRHPRMFLAYIILLDQFRRNMYRDSAAMYDTDDHCLTMTRQAIRNGLVDQLQLIERVFPCLVLTHSEEVSDQELCLSEWARVQVDLAQDDPLRVFEDIFRRHHDVIRKFGRFPHRNELLGRSSSPEEQVFLDDTTFRFDLPLIRNDEGTLVFQEGSADLDHADLLRGKAEFSYAGPDIALTNAEREIRARGFATVGSTNLRKYIIEREMPDVGSASREEIMAQIDKSNEAMSQLWPKITWVESFICNDKTYCVYLADSMETLHKHAYLAGMPIDATQEVQRVIDPYVS
ncbi:DUF924 family protein [Aliiroseovarius sp. KMU-50]|uniref:DUF924 family protein n=1 Tax=Aliiroseovarius salicola TaxID=3009082 RepID=A0ABT4VZP2_9RHOB|nr:DUF924 family protein [Aliiroseovarius sp. KMU-50]MDA5093731.1 DUF924 family protein [Aliiroseovarius sp. KMU-50]